jgi:hypothetical protein
MVVHVTFTSVMQAFVKKVKSHYNCKACKSEIRLTDKTLIVCDVINKIFLSMSPNTSKELFQFHFVSGYSLLF